MKHLKLFKLFESDMVDTINDILLDIQDDDFYIRREKLSKNAESIFISKKESGVNFTERDQFKYSEVSDIINRISSFLEQEGLEPDSGYTVDVIIPGFTFYNLHRDSLGFAKDIKNPNDTTGASTIILVRISYFFK